MKYKYMLVATAIVGMLAFLVVGVSPAGAATRSHSIVAPSTQPANPSKALPAFPSSPPANASLAAWQAWGQAQTKAMHDTNWAATIPKGDKLLSVSYGYINYVPALHIPRGVNTTAVTLVYEPDSSPTYNPNPAAWGSPSNLKLHSSTVSPKASSSGSSDPYSCKVIGGPGPVCIGSASDNGGLLISVWYTYDGSDYVAGHVTMGAGECPGSAIENGSNEYLIGKGATSTSACG